MKIVNLFTICILLSQMLLQVLTITVNVTNCSSYKDQKKCSQNKCEWITKDKTCWAKKAEVTDKSVAGVVKTEKIRKGDAIQIAKRS